MPQTSSIDVSVVLTQGWLRDGSSLVFQRFVEVFRGVRLRLLKQKLPHGSDLGILDRGLIRLLQSNSALLKTFGGAMAAQWRPMGNTMYGSTIGCRTSNAHNSMAPQYLDEYQGSPSVTLCSTFESRSSTFLTNRLDDGSALCSVQLRARDSPIRQTMTLLTISSSLAYCFRDRPMETLRAASPCNPVTLPDGYHTMHGYSSGAF